MFKAGGAQRSVMWHFGDRTGLGGSGRHPSALLIDDQDARDGTGTRPPSAARGW